MTIFWRIQPPAGQPEFAILYNLLYNFAIKNLANKLIKAINFATIAHSGQTRKGKPDVPYITHPLAVGILLAKVGSDEDVIIAGILHDTIEDTDVTKAEIVNEFGIDVAQMVNDVTEQDTYLPWADRKRLALEHVPLMSHGSLLVKSADVLHNMTDQLIDYKIEGDSMFKKFHAPKEKQKERYIKLVTALDKAWPANPLLPGLKQTLSQIQKLWI